MGQTPGDAVAKPGMLQDPLLRRPLWFPDVPALATFRSARQRRTDLRPVRQVPGGAPRPHRDRVAQEVDSSNVGSRIDPGHRPEYGLQQEVGND